MCGYNIVIGLSDWLKAYGGLAAIVSMCAGIGFYQALRRPKVQRRWHSWILKLPLIGRLNRDLNAARFARTMAGLIESGTPALTAERPAAILVACFLNRQIISKTSLKPQHRSF